MSFAPIVTQKPPVRGRTPLAFDVRSSPSLFPLPCLFSHDPLGRTGWKKKRR